VALPDPAETALLAARARAYAEVFALPLRDRHWRGGAGEFSGSGVGSSLDFQDHRAYLPGDDPRHINWQAYARSGHYSLKLYREEVRPVVEVLCDVSDSMTADPAKARRTVELVHFALASAERCGAAASLLLLKGPRWKAVERAAALQGRWTETATALPGTASSAPPNLGETPLRARSLRVLVSDLLFPAEPEPLLRALLRGQGRALVLAPFADEEAAPAWSGNCELLDTESGELHQRRIDEALLRRYAAAYRDHFARWKSASIRCRSPLARVAAALPFRTAVKHEALPAGALLLA
jgi:uncharacterized protein (DUF58 family)